MRKIFLVTLLFFIAKISFGQTVQTRPSGMGFLQQGNIGYNTWVQFNGVGYGVLGFVHGTWTDTTTANLNTYLSQIPGVQIRTGNRYWIRNNGATGWNELAVNGALPAWSTTLNSGTNTTTNGIGTSDAVDLAIKTNSTTRATVLSTGNVGIGSTNPQATLHVAGSSGSTLRIVDGNQAAGRILVSDADGDATWTAATSASVNIYNTDGTITGNRIVSGNTNRSLDFNDFLDLNINTKGLGITSTDGIFGTFSIAHNSGGIGTDITNSVGGVNGQIQFGAGQVDLNVEDENGFQAQEDSAVIYAENFRIDIPSKGAGRVLTSAANGSATWATSASAFTVPLSSLTAATVGNSINNGNFGQTWDWNTLAGSNGLLLNSSSTAATANNQKLFEVFLSGANANASQTTYAAQFSNTHTGTSSSNVAGYFASSGGTNNYAIIVPASSGDVGIGTSTPTSKLHVVPVQTTGIGVSIASSTTTTGSIVDITGTSTVLASGNEGLNIAISGANGTNAITATGARISVLNTNATSGTNIGLDITASGATTNNIGIVLREPTGGGTSGVGLKAPALAADINFTLPTALPAGTYLLNSTTAGVMGFTDPATLSGITIGTTTITSGTDTRVLFQNSGVVSQSADFVYDPGNAVFFARFASGNGTLIGMEDASNSIYMDNGTQTALVGINTATPAASLDVVGTFQTSGVNTLIDLSAGGAVTAGAGTGVLTVVSDGKAKKNIKQYQFGLKEILATKTITYQYKPEFGMGTAYYAGFDASQIYDIYGSLGAGTIKSGKNKGLHTLFDRAITAALVNGMQEQQLIIDNQQKQIDDLKKLVDKLIKEK